jgi:hypothetical protein
MARWIAGSEYLYPITPMFPLSTAPMGFDVILGNAL